MRIKIKKFGVPRVFEKYRVCSFSTHSGDYVCWSLDAMDNRSIRCFVKSVFKDEPRLIFESSWVVSGYDSDLRSWTDVARLWKVS